MRVHLQSCNRVPLPNPDLRVPSAKEEMRRLVGKYGDGYEGYLASKNLAEETAKGKVRDSVSVVDVPPESPTKLAK